ncbi:hypothetical protein Csac_1693 [Caldicellulosiruptor saccharolyticus DSM 8903]|uniref:Preprotein translocase subunit SecB n=1 Tax=Caldicellulosiruptor saccharolyticus (strain ATCC 43494 / DSM 8903 / Tp8T 6331) TaxID=351627 RepID=A4XK45_CALS8|nr:protein-export chaperone SecB [Caldicellulosiruptor saccharolyticus]ABP67280.1 hypothetical protein Csac_1693 [Caldicellulosiruptor saccharolyticus DSM 8903]
MFNWENIIFHPIQLVKTELIKLRTEKLKDIEPIKFRNIPFLLEVKSWSEAVDNANGNMYVALRLGVTEENEKIFEIEVVYKGSCICNDASISKEDFQKFLEIQSLRFLWPYLREVVSDVMSKMGLIPQPLPTIDILNTLKKNMNSGEIERDERPD